MSCKKPKCSKLAIDGARLCPEHIAEARKKAKDKIESTVKKPEGDAGCWLWKGGVQQNGYGYMSSYGTSGNSKPAHWMSLFAFGEINFDVLTHGEVHHTCKKQNCVNPNHLVHTKTEFHELLHQLSNPKVAAMVCEHLLEAYPSAVAEVDALRRAIA